MSATNNFETNLLTLLFQNTALAEVGDTAGILPSAADGSFWVSLHTGDAVDLEVAVSEQATSEIAYTGYARRGVVRTNTAAGWTISGNTADNATTITFPTSTSGPTTATRFGIGSTLTGAGNLFLYGTLTSNLTVNNGVIPQFAVGACNITLD